MPKLRRLKPGERLNGIPARTWNVFADNVDLTNRLREQGPPELDGIDRDLVTVLVKNATEGDLGQFAIVWIDQPLFGPSENLEEFKQRFAMRGSTPTADAAGRIAVLLEPAKPNKIVRAAVAGIVPCKVEVTDPGALFATEIVGNSAKLETSGVGCARILWREAGGSGEKWAIVLLVSRASAAGAEIDCRIVGSTSLGTTPPSWKYTIRRAVTDASTGQLVVATGAPDLTAFNDAEDHDGYQHGQSLTIGDATMTPGPVTGSCAARFTGVYDDDDRPLYRFDEPNPMTLECA